MSVALVLECGLREAEMSELREGKVSMRRLKHSVNVKWRDGEEYRESAPVNGFIKLLRCLPEVFEPRVFHDGYIMHREGRKNRMRLPALNFFECALKLHQPHSACH